MGADINLSITRLKVNHCMLVHPLLVSARRIAAAAKRDRKRDRC